MDMMKKILALLLCLCTALCLCSCGDKTDTDAELAEKLKSTWVCYEDGFLYFATFSNTSDGPAMSYGIPNSDFRQGGPLSEAKELTENVWQFKVGPVSGTTVVLDGTCDISDLDKGFIDLTNFAYNSNVCRFQKFLDTSDITSWDGLSDLEVAKDIKYKVTFSSDGGGFFDPLELKKGEAFPELPLAVKEGRMFEYWAYSNGDPAQPGDIMPDHDINLTAVYKEQFTVTLDTRGGDPLPPITLNVGDPLPELPTPEREDCLFSRWTDADRNTVSSGDVLPGVDTTIYAWYFGAVTITFDSKGGSSCEQMITFANRALPKLPTPKRSGYRFVCWKDKNDVPIMEGAMLDEGKITLYATWEKEGTLYFDSRGGSSCSSMKYYEDTPITGLPTPTREGYTFGHWEDKWGTPILEGALLVADEVQLYAVWIDNP